MKDLFDPENKNIPFQIRLAAVKIANSYGINGSADVGYISNLIASALNLGDGQSNFYNGNEKLKMVKVEFREEKEIDYVKHDGKEDIWEIIERRYPIPYVTRKVSLIGVK